MLRLIVNFGRAKFPLCRENPEVRKILDLTKDGKVQWGNGELTEKYPDWEIIFTAESEGRKLSLRKKRYSSYGGWVLNEELRLSEIVNGDSKLIGHYVTCQDYVETIEAQGDPFMQDLVKFVIDGFRSSMGLHWSVA